VPALRGGQEVLREAERLLPGERGESALAALREVCQILDDYGMTRFVSLDLGLVRDMDYYTGMVFEGYTAGLGFPLCGGGRYDRLLGHFGPDLPAVGFALNTDHLLTVLQRLKKLPNGQELVFVGYDEANRATAFARAEELRRQGAAVIVDVKARDKAETGREGKRLGAAVTHYYG